MSGDQNFQQRWGLRGQNDVDSSSDDSRSCSHDDLVLKKHRLVPSSQLPKNDKNKEVSNSSLPQLGTNVLPKNGSSSKTVKEDKKHKQTLAIIKPTKSDMKKKGKKTKNSRGKFKLVSLDSLNVLSKSLIDELKVAREEMFAHMNEEMGLVISHVQPISRPKKKKDSLAEAVEKEKGKNKVETGKKARKNIGESSKRSSKSDKAKDSDKSCVIIDNGGGSSKNNGSGLATETKKVNSSNVPLIKEPICNVSKGLLSSSFLNLPTPASEQRAPNLIAPATKDAINIENALFRLNEMPHQGYYHGSQIPHEQLQNISQMGFHNMNYFNQLRNQTPSTGFPLINNLQQGLRNGFGTFPSQVAGNLSRQNDTFGFRNNGGGVRFPGENKGFFGHNVGNNSNEKTD